MGELILAVVAVLTGAVLQRSTGLGFTLVCGPFLVLVLSPYDGVALANLLSLQANVLVLAATFRSVDLRSVAMLSAGVLAAILPGAAVARALPDPALLVLVGALATLAAGVVAAGRTIPGLRGPLGGLAAGLVSGFSNVTAGVGGPALAVYGASARVPRVRFVPTVQVVGIVTNASSLLAKRDAHLPGELVLACVTTVLVGIVIGRWASRYIGESAGRVTVLGLAIVGGLASVVKGVLTW